jgi:hypothetical protein
VAFQGAAAKCKGNNRWCNNGEKNEVKLKASVQHSCAAVLLLLLPRQWRVRVYTYVLSHWFPMQ